MYCLKGIKCISIREKQGQLEQLQIPIGQKIKIKHSKNFTNTSGKRCACLLFRFFRNIWRFFLAPFRTAFPCPSRQGPSHPRQGPTPTRLPPKIKIKFKIFTFLIFFLNFARIWNVFRNSNINSNNLLFFGEIHFSKIISGKSNYLVSH